MENNGWIKLHRRILENPLYKNPAWLSVWITLLLLANHNEDKEFFLEGKQIKIKPGQFVTGRKAISMKTGIPQTTVERILSALERVQQIGQQKTTKYRLITILKWKDYQMLDNKWTTNGQQTDTIKKNNKNKKYSSKKEESFLQGKEWNELIDLFSEVNPMYLSFYKNNSERKALDELAKQIGFEKTKSAIMQLPLIINKPFAPKITTPKELRRDLGKLVAFYRQEQAKGSNNGKGRGLA